MRTKDTITKGKKKLLQNLKDRYTVLEWDGGYSLYDARKEDRGTTNGIGPFVAFITIGSTATTYQYNGHIYHTVEKLEKAIDSYITTLPFGYWNYDPTYRESYFIQRCVDEYMKKLGFSQVTEWGRIPNDGTLYELKGFYGEVVSELWFNIKWDSSKGTVVKSLGGWKWVESEFDGLEEAIASINSILLPECLTKGAVMSHTLENMTDARTDTSLTGITSQLEVYKANMKQATIDRLEKELTRLKAEK